MIRKHPFVNEQIYHIFNRGVEKRDIFIGDDDYLHFIYNLLMFNSTEAPPRNTDRIIKKQEMYDLLCKAGPCTGYGDNGEPLVEILVFTLIPNHFHLMLRQLVDGGIVKFMQRIGTGHTMYFNTKYDRVGPLFQGRFKAVLVEQNAHFLYLPYYIHTNQLDLMPVQGRALHSWEKKMEFLENYRWSSFPDYIGKKNFPSVTQRDFLMESFGSEEKHKEAMIDWLKEEPIEKEEMKNILLDKK